MGELKRYQDNALEGFRNGCLLDLRVRWAFELLRGGALSDVDDTPAGVASYALDVATELLALAESRGLVEALPADGGELTPALMDQARRTASFQALQQIEGQRFGQDYQNRVMPAAVAGAFSDPVRGRSN